MSSIKNGIYQFSKNVLDLKGTPISENQKKMEHVYLTGLNYLCNKYINDCNRWRKIIFLIKSELMKFLLLFIAILTSSVLISVLSGSIIAIATLLPIGVVISLLVLKKILFLKEELGEAKVKLKYQDLEYEITGIKELNLPIYLNKVSEDKIIIADAAKIFTPVNFLFQIMNDSNIVKDGFNTFKEKFKYLNRFMLMPNRRDYDEILEEKINSEAIRNQLIEKILNPSFERISMAFNKDNIEETRISLNAVKEGTWLVEEVKNAFLNSDFLGEVNDLIGYVNQQKRDNWLVYQSVNDLKNVISSLHNWIVEIVRSDLPTYLSSEKSKIGNKMEKFESKLKITKKMIKQTFHKDIKLFKAFNNYHYCKHCGSTNYIDILDKINVRNYVERVLLNNATDDEVLKVELAPPIVKDLIEDNQQKIETAFVKLPIFENIQGNWGIDESCFPKLVSDFKSMKLEMKSAKGGIIPKYEYICPQCKNDDYIEVNRAIEPLAFSYFANINVLKERMDKEKNTFIRNISDVKLSKEEKLLDIGPYELAYLESLEKLNDLKMQIDIAKTILAELNRS